MPITINGTTGISGVDGSAGTPALQGSDTNTGIAFGSDVIIGSTGGTERFRCDSSGRMLVGTSTADTSRFGTSTYTPQFQVKGAWQNGSASITCTNDYPALWLNGTGGTSAGAGVGIISFNGYDGTNYTQAAAIKAEVDGTASANDMPGRLVFSVTSDGASSPTEAMRITQDRGVAIGGDSGSMVSSGGYVYIQRQSATPAFFNRNTNDGEIVQLRQDNNTEGSISVSGTTVSYNGAHLSRWSQLPSGAEREEILRGTVLSNIDEMCEWGEEDNEQLNRMKVSDVEGDKNVSGVFQAWDDDDDTYVNDFYCAMTGDFIIRIGAGVTVERGDLLMSAGDGTAKPQDDDIIRSKTIAKVTSTNVSCTYDDGSYCVPCVLMAC